MTILRSLLFNFFLYTGITVVFLIALPSLFLPSKITLLFGKLLGHYVVLVVRIFLNTKVEFKGTENIPQNQKYFVASAHQSMFETFALQSVLDYPVFILKKELLKIPIFGWHLKKIGSISIDRDKVSKENLGFYDKIIIATTKTKRPVIIFPQATRTEIGDRQSFKKGVSKIYEKLNFVCLPVALNSGNVWPKSGRLGSNKTITVSILKQIPAGLNSDDFLKNLEHELYCELENIR